MHQLPPQQAYIFSGSILDNLTLGANQAISQEDIQKTCEMPGYRSDIEQMPMGYPNELSDRLVYLAKTTDCSARALLTKAPVLILDEATSGLDVLTEKKVIDNLMAMTIRNHYLCCLSSQHFQNGNQVIVLDQGKINETGSHKN